MSPCFRCAIAALIALLLAVAVVVVLAEPPTEPTPAPETERIPVLHIQLDGTIILQTVELPKSPHPQFMNFVCFREFDVKEIGCYLLNSTERRAIRLDLPLKE